MTIPMSFPVPEITYSNRLASVFFEQPVHFTAGIINAENGNLPVHFINHSDQEVVIPKHSYAGAMEKVQESDQDLYHTDAFLEPVNKCALSECLAQSDFLPNQRQQLYVLQENSGTFGSSIADLTIAPLVKHYIDTGNAKPIKQESVSHQPPSS